MDLAVFPRNQGKGSMDFLVEQRASDSPFIETVTWGRTVSSGSVLRPATNHWHMVFVKHDGIQESLVVGPWSQAGMVSFGDGGEVLWLQLKLGVFMPRWPPIDLLNREVLLAGAGGSAFWLDSTAWQAPTHENVETFVHRLARREVMLRDAVVDSVLCGRGLSVAPRTVRQRFLRATGLTQNHIFQFDRAQHAAQLLQQGVPILDVVDQLGYYDQPHLTHALKRFTGMTPAQFANNPPDST